MIIPAIDIRNGKCVRLTQGDFAKEKIYNDDPIAVARQWEQKGATKIHVVDLDGAKNGEPSNIEIIKLIIKTVTIPVQVGGGIRNKKTIERLLQTGAAKIILGTIALEDKNELKNIVASFPTQVAIALDAKNGKLMTDGWFKESTKNLLDSLQQFEKLGVQEFIYTDVIKDGSLTEPNYGEIKKIIKNSSIPLIVGGGISNIEQIEKLKTMGVKGVIIGKALYENKLTLKEVQNVN